MSLSRSDELWSSSNVSSGSKGYVFAESAVVGNAQPGVWLPVH